MPKGLSSVPGRDKRVFSAQTDSEAHPASHPIITGYLSPEVKRLGREADDLPPSSAEVKDAGSMPPLSHTSSRRWCLIKCAQGQLYLYVYIYISKVKLSP
jgi:hypothetical protein